MQQIEPLHGSTMLKRVIGFFMAFVVVVGLLVTCGFVATKAFADSDVSSVSAKVVSYDVSNAGKYTNYQISDSGEYYLSGRSKSVGIVVQPKENALINIYLEGNLSIDPDWNGRRGVLSATPAISVGEAKGATVNIILLEGTDAYLGGYYGAAGIRKNGTATKLVFKTIASDGSGKITVVGSSHGSCPGIGVDGGKGTVGGNIVFESGTVEARGHDAPGIGCKDGNVSISDVTFSGATVTATGSGGNSAGIGSGKDGTAKNIMITGGTVTATGAGAGAGIGSGGNGIAQDIYVAGGTVTATGSGAGAGIGAGRNGTVKNIVVSGGMVTATGGTGSYGGAGIGSGANVDSERNGSAQDIIVSGGTVTATGGSLAAGIGGAYGSPVYNIMFGVVGQPPTNLSVFAQGGSQGAGIGAGTGETRTTAERIVVYGGTINATGSSEGGAGIGSGYQSGRCSDIRIVGGTVTAIGGQWSSGIGGAMMSGTFSGITIDGGVITAKRGADSYDQCDIGSSSTMDIRITGGTIDAAVASYGLSPIVITGGTVREISTEFDTPTLVDDKGQPVYRTIATVEGLTESTHIEDLNIGMGQSSSTQRFNYGQTDLYTLGADGEQKLFLYLPASTYTRTAIDVNGQFYRGNIYPGQTGMLRLSANVLLDSGQGASYDGSAFAFYGASQLEIEEDPYDELGRDVDHYTDSVGAPVADANGNIYNNKTNFTENGVWTSHEANVALQTVWENETYTIAYKTNKPDNASTQMQGYETSSYVTAGEEARINSNTFVLPGYQFVGWNTQSDGSGLLYEDGSLVDDELLLEADYDNVVTLYAQWKPLTYQVTFAAGDGMGIMEPQTLVFDQTATLSRNIFECEGDGGARSFLHWSDDDGTNYVDGATVKNLCTMSTGFNPVPVGKTLTAQWSFNNSVVITITNNGEPVVFGNPSEDIELVNSQDSTNRVSGFTATNVAGVYQLSNVNPGTYTVDINSDQAAGFPTDATRVLEVTSAGSNSFNLNYCTITVDVTENEHVNAWIGSSPEPAPSTRTVFQGDTVSVQAVVNPDEAYPYVFTGYDVEGIVPDDFNPNSADSQTVTVTGGVTLTAHARPISYDIAFDSNVGSASTADRVTGSMDALTGVSATDQVELPICAFGLPGYQFVGWNTQTDGSGASFADGAVVENLATADGQTVMLYAQWESISYTVAFDAGGGEGEMDAQTFVFDTQQTLTKNAFSRADYTFAGWATEPNSAEGATYEDGAVVNNLTETAGEVITLYAQWQRDTYTVTFDANSVDAVGTMADEEVFTLDDWMVPGCGFTRAGYVFEGWNTQADGRGTSYETGSVVSALAQKDGAVTLYAQWNPISYTVAFDANVPATASTADLMIGEMSFFVCIYDVASVLPVNEFVLPGYQFAGWNTQPDGSGTLLEDGVSINNLTTNNEETVVLYAQWKPLTYEVMFEGVEGTSGSMAPQTFVFDKPAALKANEFDITDGGCLVGWTTLAETGGSPHLYSDGQTVVNLCTFNDDGTLSGITLIPIFTWENGAYVTLTKDNEPLSGASVSLIGEDGSTVGPMTELSDEMRGTYYLGDITPGTYEIAVAELSANGATLTVQQDDIAHVFLSYSTIALVSGDEHTTVQLNGSADELSAVMLAGTEVSVSADVGEGYIFDGWAVDGVVPQGIDMGSSVEQTVEVRGKVTLTAHAKPISYSVTFDANGGEGSLDPQIFAYDEAKELTANSFTREGYTFAGWNTKVDGTGDSYSDKQKVVNLVVQDGATVVLYAQWDEALDPEPGPDPDPDPDPDPEPEPEPDPGPEPDPDPDPNPTPNPEPSPEPGSDSESSSASDPNDTQTVSDGLLETGDTNQMFIKALCGVVAVSAIIVLVAGIRGARR